MDSAMVAAGIDMGGREVLE